MRLYDRHTQIFISYDTVVPDKTKFVSLLHERQTDTQTDTLTQTDTQTHSHRHIDTLTQTDTQTHSHRQTHRHTHTDRHSHTHRHTHTDRHNHTDRQTDRHSVTLKQLCCVWEAAGVPSNKHRYKKSVTRSFVFIAMDHFRNKFYCRLHSDQLKRQYRETGRNGQLLKAHTVQRNWSERTAFKGTDSTKIILHTPPSGVYTVLKMMWCTSAVHFYSTVWFSF